MSLLFDANTDAVTCGDVDIEGATALTAAVIAHPTSVGGGGAVRAYMVKKEAIALQDEGLGSTRFYVTSGGASLSYRVNLGGGGIAITAGQSYHIVARWRASDQTLKIQINGVDQPLTQVDVGSPASIANTTYNWSIGYNADWGTNSVQGQMQDSSLAASYFSDADALALWNGGGTQSGTCQAADATHITLAAGASSSDDTYNGWFITAGGETYIITDYVGSTRVATISGTWAATPTGGVSAYVANKAKSMEHFSAKAILRMGSTADLTDYTNNGWNGTNSGTTNGSFAATLDYPAAVPPDPPTYSSGTLAGLPAGTEGDLSTLTLGTHSSGDGTPTHEFTVKDADGNVISGATFTVVWSDDVDFDGVVGDVTLTGRGTIGATITVDVASDTFTATNINGSTGNDAVNDASVTNGSAVYHLQANVRQYGVVVATLSGDDSVESDESDGMIVAEESADEAVGMLARGRGRNWRAR